MELLAWQLLPCWSALAPGGLFKHVELARLLCHDVTLAKAGRLRNKVGVQDLLVHSRFSKVGNFFLVLRGFQQANYVYSLQVIQCLAILEEPLFSLFPNSYGTLCAALTSLLVLAILSAHPDPESFMRSSYFAMPSNGTSLVSVNLLAFLRR